MDKDFFDLEFSFVPPVRVEPEKSALLIVDMQYLDASPDHGVNLALEKIRPGSCEYYNKRVETTVVPAIQKLLQYFRSHKLAVVYLVLGSQYRDLRDFNPRQREWISNLESMSGVADILWDGAPHFAVLEEITPQEGETIIEKASWGAFNTTNIERVLRDLGIDILFVTGCSTNACLETTARDAADRGFGVVLVDEGCVDYDQEAHDAALKAFYFNFGKVLWKADDVIRVLEEQSVIP
jgi:nicotinamidase-related amidase